MPKRPESPDVPEVDVSNPWDAERYVRKGTGCPYCGTKGNPEGGSFEVLENGVAQQEMTCTECGEVWFDIYYLNSVFDYRREVHYGRKPEPEACKWCGALQTIPGEDVHTRNCQEA